MLLPIRRLFRTALGTAAAATVVALSAHADAQSLPSIDARTWRAPTDPNASLVVEPAATPGPGVFSFGGFTSYAYRPLTLRKAGTDDVALRPVEHMLGLDAVANLGIGQRFAIGANVPLVLYQDGTRPLPPTVSQVDATPSSGIGDIGITMKGALVRNEGGGLGVAALGNFTLPTGDRASFMGEGAVTAGARVLVEYTLLVAAVAGEPRVQAPHRAPHVADRGGRRLPLRRRDPVDDRPHDAPRRPRGRLGQSPALGARRARLVPRRSCRSLRQR